MQLPAAYFVLIITSLLSACSAACSLFLGLPLSRETPLPSGGYLVRSEWNVTMVQEAVQWVAVAALLFGLATVVRLLAERGGRA